MTSDPSVAVRVGVPRDAATLAAFGAVTFRATYLDATPAEALDAFIAGSFSTAIQSAELADPACCSLLAEVEGELSGYLQLRVTPPPAGVLGDRPVALDRFYVSPAAQGHGVGSALLDRAVREATSRGHDVLWLSVWEHNHRAIAIYRHWGASDVGEVTFDLAGVQQTDRLMVLPCRDRASGG